MVPTVLAWKWCVCHVAPMREIEAIAQEKRERDNNSTRYNTHRYNSIAYDNVMRFNNLIERHRAIYGNIV